MSARERAAAAAARFSSSPSTSPAVDDRTDADQDAALAIPASVELGRQVRSTYLLHPPRYRAFGARCDEAAVELGEARVTKQDAVEALVRLLETDETVRRRWLAMLRTMARERQ